MISETWREEKRIEEHLVIMFDIAEKTYTLMDKNKNWRNSKPYNTVEELEEDYNKGNIKWEE